MPKIGDLYYGLDIPPAEVNRLLGKLKDVDKKIAATRSGRTSPAAAKALIAERKEIQKQVAQLAQLNKAWNTNTSTAKQYMAGLDRVRRSTENFTKTNKVTVQGQTRLNNIISRAAKTQATTAKQVSKANDLTGKSFENSTRKALQNAKVIKQSVGPAMASLSTRLKLVQANLNSMSPNFRRSITDLQQLKRELVAQVTVLRNFGGNTEAAARKQLEYTKALNTTEKLLQQYGLAAMSANERARAFSQTTGGLIARANALNRAVSSGRVPYSMLINDLQKMEQELKDQMRAMGGVEQQTKETIREYERLGRVLATTSKNTDRVTRGIEGQGDVVDDAGRKIRRTSRFSSELTKAWLIGLGPQGYRLFLVMDVLGDSVRIVGNRLREATTAAAIFGTILSTIGTLIGLVVGASIIAGIAAFSKLEQSMADFAKVTGNTVPGLERMRQAFTALTRDLPTTTGELFDIATVAAQLGVQGEQNIFKFTKAIALLDLAAVGLGTTANASENLGRFLTQTGTTMEEFGDEALRVAGILNILENNTNATAGEILEQSRRLSTLQKVAGLGRAEILALGAAMESAGVDAGIAATSLRDFFFNLSGAIFESSETLSAWVALTGLSQEQMRSLADETDGYAVILGKLITNVDMANTNQGDMLRLLGAIGVEESRRQGVLTSLIQVQEQYNIALGVAGDELEAMDLLYRELEIKQNTLRTQVQLLKNRFRALAEAIGQELVPDLTEALQAWNDNDEAIAMVGATIIGFKDVVVGIVKVMFAAMRGMGLGLANISEGIGGAVAIGVSHIKDLIMWVADLVESVMDAGRFLADLSPRSFRPDRVVGTLLEGGVLAADLRAAASADVVSEDTKLQVQGYRLLMAMLREEGELVADDLSAAWAQVGDAFGKFNERVDKLSGTIPALTNKFDALSAIANGLDFGGLGGDDDDKKRTLSDVVQDWREEVAGLDRMLEAGLITPTEALEGKLQAAQGAVEELVMDFGQELGDTWVTRLISEVERLNTELGRLGPNLFLQALQGDDTTPPPPPGYYPPNYLERLKERERLRRGIMSEEGPTPSGGVYRPENNRLVKIAEGAVSDLAASMLELGEASRDEVVEALQEQMDALEALQSSTVQGSKAYTEYGLAMAAVGRKMRELRLGTAETTQQLFDLGVTPRADLITALEKEAAALRQNMLEVKKSSTEWLAYAATLDATEQSIRDLRLGAAAATQTMFDLGLASREELIAALGEEASALRQNMREVRHGGKEWLAYAKAVQAAEQSIRDLRLGTAAITERRFNLGLASREELIASLEAEANALRRNMKDVEDGGKEWLRYAEALDAAELSIRDLRLGTAETTGRLFALGIASRSDLTSALEAEANALRQNMLEVKKYSDEWVKLAESLDATEESMRQLRLGAAATTQSMFELGLASRAELIAAIEKENNALRQNMLQVEKGTERWLEYAGAVRENEAAMRQLRLGAAAATQTMFDLGLASRPELLAALKAEAEELRRNMLEVKKGSEEWLKYAAALNKTEESIRDLRLGTARLTERLVDLGLASHSQLVAALETEASALRQNMLEVKKFSEEWLRYAEALDKAERAIRDLRLGAAATTESLFELGLASRSDLAADLEKEAAALRQNMLDVKKFSEEWFKYAAAVQAAEQSIRDLRLGIAATTQTMFELGLASREELLAALHAEARALRSNMGAVKAGTAEWFKYAEALDETERSIRDLRLGAAAITQRMFGIGLASQSGLMAALEAEAVALQKNMLLVKKGGEAWLEYAEDLDATHQSMRELRLGVADTAEALFDLGMISRPQLVASLEAEAAALQRNMREVKKNSDAWLDYAKARADVEERLRGLRLGTADTTQQMFDLGLASRADLLAALEKESAALRQNMGDVQKGGARWLEYAKVLSDVQVAMRELQLGASSMTERLFNLGLASREELVVALHAEMNALQQNMGAVKKNSDEWLTYAAALSVAGRALRDLRLGAAATTQQMFDLGLTSRGALVASLEAEAVALQKNMLQVKKGSEEWLEYATALNTAERSIRELRLGTAEITERMFKLGEVSRTALVAALEEEAAALRENMGGTKRGTAEWLKYAEALDEVEGRIRDLRLGAAEMSEGLFAVGAISRAGLVAALEREAEALRVNMREVKKNSDEWLKYAEALGEVEGRIRELRLGTADLADRMFDLGMIGRTGLITALEEEAKALQVNMREVKKNSDEWIAYAEQLAGVTEKVGDLGEAEIELARIYQKAGLGSRAAVIDAIQEQIAWLEKQIRVTKEATAAHAGYTARLVDLKTQLALLKVQPFLDALVIATDLMDGLSRAIEGFDTGDLKEGLMGIAETAGAAAVAIATAINPVAGAVATVIVDQVLATLESFLSLLGDISNGAQQVREELEDMAKSSNLLSFDFLKEIAFTERVSRGGILGFLGFTKEAIDEELTSFAVSLAEAIAGGLRNGIIAGIRGDQDWKETLRNGIKEAVFNALLDAMIKAAILETTLADFIKKFTEILERDGRESALQFARSRIPTLIMEMEAVGQVIVDAFKGTSLDPYPVKEEDEVLDPTGVFDLPTAVPGVIQAVPGWVNKLGDIVDRFGAYVNRLVNEGLNVNIATTMDGIMQDANDFRV